jgi:predicted  nucleic acid-binding Zn-ribbon protein
LSEHELTHGACLVTSRLYDLQQIDTALAAVLARRSGLDDGTAQRDVVAATTEHLEAIARETAAVRTRQRALELEVQSLRAKRAKIEREMYSGRIGNPKELAAMQEDAAALGRHIGQVEDQELALMEQQEGLEADRRAAEQQLEAASADLARILDAFARDSAAADAEIATLAARRDAVAAEIDEDLRRRYERLLEKKGGLAVVTVAGGVCGGCHVMIPQRLLSRLERDREAVATCDGCGRILVVG